MAITFIRFFYTFAFVAFLIKKKCGQYLKRFRYYVAVAQRFNRLKTLKSLLKF